jgi:hypothetical protein
MANLMKEAGCTDVNAEPALALLTQMTFKFSRRWKKKTTTKC